MSRRPKQVPGPRPAPSGGEACAPRAPRPLGRFPRSRAASRGRPQAAARGPQGPSPEAARCLQLAPQRAAQGGLPRPCGRPPMGAFGCQPCDGKPRAPPCASRGAPGSPVSCPRPDRRELRSARSGRRSRWTALRRPDPAPPKTARLTLLQGWPRTSSHGCRFASVCPMPRAAGDRRVTARRSCATPAHLGGQATACSYALTFTGGEWGQKSALDPRARLCAPRSVGTFPSVHQAAVGVDSGLVRICVMVQRARTLE